MLQIAPSNAGEENIPAENSKKVMLRVKGNGDPELPVAPKGYKPLSVQQRKDWNNFLDYLDKSGVGGSPELDKRDQSLGLKYLEQYRQANPQTTVNKDVIPLVQYEQNLLRKGNQFPGLKPEELAYIKKGLSPAYLNRPTSDVDSWLGSLTSKSYYPTGQRSTSQGAKYDFGVNFEDYVRSLQDASLQEKYRVK